MTVNSDTCDLWPSVLLAVKSGDAGFFTSRSPTDALAVANAREPEGGSARTVLMLAYWFGQIDLVRVLIALGADSHARDIEARSVAWYADHAGLGKRADQIKDEIEGGLVRQTVGEALGIGLRAPGPHAIRRRRRRDPI